ncbi:putative 26S proteasome regulatory subunit 10B [Acropora cervicornis]|uniref:26S proteasome regulatory subunit 10B n=1 Tax=Acropora cervicornis TaxID=6130 RepID=A0AAD9R597_ACRCE|nr:putative 26S proteasome regulatory subunit 10B [Acropora cervicornis]
MIFIIKLPSTRNRGIRALFSRKAVPPFSPVAFHYSLSHSQFPHGIPSSFASLIVSLWCPIMLCVTHSFLVLLNQMDGFDALGQVKIIMATNRPDTLDPALLRPGRLDRKIEIPLPNEQARMDILKIHSAKITKHGDIDYEAVVKLSDGFNGADLRNVCTEAGMFAIRAERDYVIEEDFMKAARKVSDNKKLESKLDYKPV